MKTLPITILLIIISTTIFGQNITNYSSALAEAKRANKDVLIICYDSSIRNKPNVYLEDRYLDSLSQTQYFIDQISPYYIPYKLPVNEIPDSLLSTELVEYSTSRVYSVSNTGYVYNYVDIYSFTDSTNIPKIINAFKTSDSIKLVLPNIYERVYKNKVDTTELESFIKHRIKLRLSSGRFFDQYTSKSKTLNSNLLYPAFESTDISTTRSVFQNYFESPKRDFEWNMIINETISRKLEKSKYNKDSLEFESAISYYEKIKNTDPIYPKNYIYHDYSVLTKVHNATKYKFEFYKNIRSIKKAKEYGRDLVAIIITNYKLLKTEYFKQSTDLQDSYPGIFEKSEFEKQYPEKARQNLLKHRSNEFNSLYAANINEVAWSYYELTYNTEELQEALIWSERAYQLFPSAEYLDTSAHLLFKLGNKKAAIEKQKQAVTLAEKQSNHRLRRELEENLAKFVK